METTTKSHNASRKQTSRLAQHVGSVLIALSLTVSSGCSVYMASHQADKKDTTLLKPGTPRSILLAEFGQPVVSETKEGKHVDLFSFVQGSSEGAKTGRAFFYGVADVFTLGLFEVVGTPVETAMKGDKLTYEVTYDVNDRVEKVVPIGKGASSEPAGQSPQAPWVPEMKDKKPDTMQTKVEQTAPTQSANSMAPMSQDSGVTAQEQPSQDKSVAAGIENAAPGASPNVQLVMSYEDGMNAYGQKDYTKALSIFRGLADQGDARAQTNLGLMYERGVGVAKDDAEAVKWFRKAADQGFVTAQFNLGYMYSNGRGVAKDDSEAIKWYRKAADRGNATAQFNLGRKYEQGEGVAKDHGEAVKWFHKAADQGYAPAQETLRQLGGQ